MTEQGTVYYKMRRIYESAISRVDPYLLVRDALRLTINRLLLHTGETSLSFNLRRFKKIQVWGLGKAAAPMARAVEDILAQRLDSGYVITKYGHTAPLSRLELLEAGHPIPDSGSLRAGCLLRKLCADADKQTLLIGLISGGGSSLLCHPLQPASPLPVPDLEEMQGMNSLLLKCGASITEINTLRKHISALKGGRLAQISYPATSLNLLLSDVIGDSLDTIASGLTVPDPTTYNQALGIINKYGLEQELPRGIQAVLKAGARGELEETPKNGDQVFDNVHNVLVGNNHLALEAAAAQAKKLGFKTRILSGNATGEASRLASDYADLARTERHAAGQAPLCLLAGGEPTVTLSGNGKGGRNQELALAFLREIKKTPGELKGVYFLSGATDGGDGPTDAAGAFAGYEVLAAAEKKRLSPEDYLHAHNSYPFFDQLGFLLKTGPTKTNVCDLHILIIMPGLHNTADGCSGN